MKPFNFKLEPALNLKLKEEERQKEEVFQVREVLTQNETLLNSLQSKLARLQEELRQQQQEAINLAQINSYHSYLPVLDRKIEGQIERVRLLEEHVEKAQEILISIRRERKALEKLKERRYQDYQMESRREEQKSSDEMANRKIFFRHDSALNGGYS